MLFKKMQSLETKILSYSHVRSMERDRDTSTNTGKEKISTDAEKGNRKFSLTKTIRRPSVRTGFDSAKQSHQIAKQGLYYVVAFYITWTFPTINRIYELAGTQAPFAVQLLDTALISLQGALNCFVYLKPSIDKQRTLDPEAGYFSALNAAIQAKE